MTEKTHETKSGDGGGRRRRWWSIHTAVKVLVVTMAVLGVVAVGMMKTPERTVEPNEVPAVNVKVMKVVSERGFADAFILPAVVEPNRVVTISAEVAARVERIPAEEGDSIEAGDLLVQLNDELIRPQVESTRAQVSRDQIEFERMETLFRDDATSRQDLDNATTALKASEAQLAEMEARLERTRIFAPLTGVLNDLPVEEGEYVNVGTAVAEVVDMAVVKVVVDVPERDIAFFRVGGEAEVLVQRPDAVHCARGMITYINELADPQTRSTAMEITLDNGGRTFRSGQIVRVSLTRRVIDNAILIPLQAVIPQEDGYSVYVVKDGQVARRDVTLDVVKGDRVQITSGLAPGDTLIIEGHRLAAPGQKVNIVSGNR